jgi:hypothetical protein
MRLLAFNFDYTIPFPKTGTERLTLSPDVSSRGLLPNTVHNWLSFLLLPSIHFHFHFLRAARPLESSDARRLSFLLVLPPLTHNRHLAPDT